MKISNFKFKIIGGLLVVGGLFVPYSVHAQSLRTITVVPPTIQEPFNPGSRSEGTLKVINDSSETLTFNALTRDYIVIDTNGTPNILPPNTLTNKYSAAAWVGIAPSTFVVGPHQKQELTYFIQIPADARPGGHYTAVVFEPVNPTGIDSTGSSINAQIGTLFYISVNGDIIENAKVTKFFANPFQEYGPTQIATQVTNYGDLHIRPSMTLTVTDIFGRTIAKQSVDQKNIFPGSGRDFVNTVGQQLMIGPFTAKLVGTYGKANNLPLMATVTFWVFPWKVTLVIILVIIAIILGMMYRKTQKEKKNNTPPTKAEEPPVNA